MSIIKTNIRFILIIALIWCSCSNQKLTFEYSGITKTIDKQFSYSILPITIIQKKDTSFLYKEKSNGLKEVRDTIITIKDAKYLVKNRKKYLIQTTYKHFYKDTLYYPFGQGCVVAIPDSIVTLHNKKVMKYTIDEKQCEIEKRNKHSSFSNGTRYVYPPIGTVKLELFSSDIDNVITNVIEVKSVILYDSHKEKKMNWWDF
jgi:hypothetical protein